MKNLRRNLARQPKRTTSDDASLSKPPKDKQTGNKRKKYAIDVGLIGPSGVIPIVPPPIPRIIKAAAIPHHVHLDLPFEESQAPEQVIRIIIDDRRSKHARRRHSQAARWEAVILPSMMRPFMEYQRNRADRRLNPTPLPSVQSCGCRLRHHSLQIIGVEMERLSHIVLKVCSRHPATEQLIRLGMFPCSPVNPRLAVSLDMLKFVSELFVHVAPNERGWADTLHTYLENRNHLFEYADSLRRRFANALRHYQMLVQLVQGEMSRIINIVRTSPAIAPSTIELDSVTSVGKRDYLTPSNVAGSTPETKPSRKNHSTQTSSTHDLPSSPTHGLSSSSSADHDPPPTPLPPTDQAYPSPYLRSRCPLCFGGNETLDASEIVQVIVCIDANFQIKRNHDRDLRKGHENQQGTRDPVLFSPRTIILARPFLEEWEARVDGIRNPAEPSRKRKANEMSDYNAPDVTLDIEEEDRVESGMKLPNSALDTCQESFTAADGNRIKASTQYFDDTGLMAILCRHDRPLYIANMWTAGEKQFYALGLLDSLVKGLPTSWRIGLLYDVACQLHRSLTKWDLVPEWRGRIEFGVSVFHAYGHQWVCQLWYHPRKSEVWGLSDGEGCERFWSELRKLIPNLRVSGYHRRLFVIDLQVEHIDEVKTRSLGAWLQERVTRTRGRLVDAELKLGDQSIPSLLAQFKSQRNYQSKPVLRQSKKRGAQAVDTIIALSHTADSLRTVIRELREELSSLVAHDVAGTSMQQASLMQKINIEAERVKMVEVAISKQTSALQLSDSNAARDLEKLKKDKWLNLQLNLRVIRNQILTKLRARKFELANLERAYRSRTMDRQTQDHAEKAIKHREPGINANVKRYNDKRQEMLRARGKGGVPSNAYIPTEIKAAGLFTLDVDADILQDTSGVGSEDFEGGVLPAWLVDDEVKGGIRAAQDVINCRNELQRCKLERTNLQLWFLEEYDATEKALSLVADNDVRFFIEARLQALQKLQNLWMRQMRDVPSVEGMPPWHPVASTRSLPPREIWASPLLCGPRSPVRALFEPSPDEEATHTEVQLMSSDDDSEEEVEATNVVGDFVVLASMDHLALT